MAESTTVELFFNRISSSRFVFPDGSEMAFIGGRGFTKDPAQVAHLESEIAKGHPFIFRDPSQLTIDEKLLDPAEALKAKIIEEAIAAGIVQRASESEYEAPVLKPASSADLVDTKTPEEVIVQAAKESSLVAETGSAVEVKAPSPIGDDKLAALLASVK